MDGDKTTLIDVNAAVTGEFHGKDIRILGRFEGELRVSGSFVMGEGSHVAAKVQADRAEISGTLAGEIVARHLVCLEKANVSGSVDTQTLAVHEGAVINGPVTAGEGARKSLDASAPAPMQAPPAAGPSAEPAPEPERVAPGDPDDADETPDPDATLPAPTASETEKPDE